MPSYGGSSWPRDQTRLSCIVGRFFTTRYLGRPSPVFLGFPCGSAGKEFFCNAGDLGLIPGSGRSPGEGKGYPLQYSGLENSMGCIGHEVSKSWTQLNNFHTSCIHLGSPNVLQRFYNFFKKLWFSIFEPILLCMCAKSLQSCLSPCDPMDCSPPGSSVHGILQARILESVTIFFSRGSSWPRDQTHVSLYLLRWH